MSGKTEKKKRRAIRKYVEENKDVVLEVVLHQMQTAKLKQKIAFCFIILFRRKL